MHLHHVAEKFALHSAVVSLEPFGEGHINETYLVKTEAGVGFVLQKLNHHVFRDIPGLMRNFAAVTRHIARKDADPRHTLSLVTTLDGGDYLLDGDGEYWRMSSYIPDSICLNRVESAADMYQSGLAFGHFQGQLSDFPAETLVETIPRFHDTPNRYLQLIAAIKADVKGRVREVQPEIEFLLARREEAGSMVGMLRRGELPLRVTHNDTKLNNVMLDAKTREPLCVIDLDTVMPGLAANDFGDSIRFGASTAAEDEPNLELVHLSLPYYEAYTRGFLRGCGGNLTANEVATLPLGAKLMTLECGLRFLADYLAGDVYFHIARPSHNLDRARTQFKLIQETEAHWDEIAAIIAREAKALAR